MEENHTDYGSIGESGPDGLMYAVPAHRASYQSGSTGLWSSLAVASQIKQHPEPEAFFQHIIDDLFYAAGMVVEINLENLKPLAMGNVKPVVKVRKRRHRGE